MNPPKWTVVCNLVSPEGKAWVGTSWEFFNTQVEAQKCYERHEANGDCPTKRPFHQKDLPHMGIVHQRRLAEAEVEA